MFSSFLCPHNTFFLAEEEGRSFEDIEQNQTIMTLGLVGEKCLTVESSLNYFSPNVGSKRCEDVFSGCAKNGAREAGVLAPLFARPNTLDEREAERTRVKGICPLKSLPSCK